MLLLLNEVLHSFVLPVEYLEEGVVIKPCESNRVEWILALQLTMFLLGFPDGSDGEESACNMGTLGSILGLGSCPGEGNSYPLQYSGLENYIFLLIILTKKT